MSVMFMGGAVLIAGSKLFTKILLADSYYESWKFVPILVLATVFSTLVSFLGSVYFLKKKSTLSMLTAMAGAVINVILNFVLIPGHAAMGAAVATAISYFAVFLLRAYDVKQYVSFSLSPLLVGANTALLLLQSGCLLFDVRVWYAHPAIFLGAMALLNGKNLWDFARELLPSRKKEKNPEKI
jgi:O-antigen/teichoic acid export membrane protein